MLRHFVRKFQTIGVVASFTAMVAIQATLAAQVQVRNRGLASAESSSSEASLPMAEAAPARQHPLLPGALKAQHLPRNHGQGKSRVLPMDSENPFFQPVELFNTGLNTSYSSVTVADVNGDGKPDLVVASEVVTNGVPGDGSVNIFLGNGDGTFQAATTYDTGGTDPSSVAVADVNGDGMLDLVVTNECASGTWGNSCSSESLVSILLGNGDGTFRAAQTFPSGGANASQVVIADVNGDGKPDAVVSNCAAIGLIFCGDNEGVVGVLLGNGDGTFQRAVGYESGGHWGGSLAVADVNKDGKLDIVVTNFCGSSGGSCSDGTFPEGSVSVLLGTGDGTFEPAVWYDSGWEGASAVAVADVNGDGKPDLLVGNCGPDGCDPSAPGVVGVLLGNGNGTFQPPMTYPTASGVTSIKAADVNLDGKLDLVVATWGAGLGSIDGAVGVLLGNGDGTFQATVTADSGEAYAGSLAVADVNGDGKPDAIVTNDCRSGCLVNTGSTVGVLLNDTGLAQSSTTTTLVSSANPSAFGQVVTFTATVSAPTRTPTGTVIFYDGSTQLGSAGLANLSASISVSLALGSHPITAAYQGARTFGASTSAPVNQVVNQATSTTTLASSKNPAPINHHVTYTATVTSQFGGAVTGTVTFQDGGVTIATVTLARNQAGYRTSYSAIGIHSITATYSGDGNNVSSMSAVLKEEIGGPYATKTVLTTSGSPSKLGQPVTFTATLTPIYGAIPDGELVTFYDGAKAIGTGATAGDVATFTTSSLTARKHTIKATYAGDGTFKPSAGKVTQVVDQ